MDNDFSKIKELRNTLGWSQERLAEAANVNVKTVARMELGRTKPQQESLQKILAALNTGERVGGLPTEAVKRPKQRIFGRVRAKRSAVKTAPIISETAPLTSIDVQLVNLVLEMSEKEKVWLMIELEK
jgi:transcriptional regulator with XRE-family HTH domain